MNQTLLQRIQTLGNKLYLLRVSIGPVQEFINEARKTRDLYIGSHLLSLATLKSMKPIFDNNGVIIYPYLADSKNSSHNSIPNLYMAVIPEDGLNRTTEQMKNALHDFMNDMGKKVVKELQDNSEFETLWRYQINDHFYLNWVAIPITTDELIHSYKSKVRDIQNFLDERKLTRTFESWKGSNDKKCVQCGHRESIQYEIYKKFKTRIKENERLCAICLTKRLLKARYIEKEEPDFESVVDVSARNFKQLVESYKAKKEIQNFLNVINDLKVFLGDNRVDDVKQLSGEWFYKDNLNHNFLKKEYGLKDDLKIKELKKYCEQAQRALDLVYKTVERKPSKYYAIVSMDGDDMGKLMSGEYLDNEKFTFGYQTKLSKILAETGRKAYDLIENRAKGNGYCVYSGGDDLLAFLPIEKSLTTINETRSSFSEEFKNIERPPTSSAGVAILHYHDPLRRGLIEARNGVENAKEWFQDKDAFVITLRVSSGTVVTWGSKWAIDNFTIHTEDTIVNIGQIKILDILARFVSFMIEDPKNRLSPDFVHDLMGELPAFYECKYKSEWFFNDKMFKAEFKRLLKRHIPKDSNLWKNRYIPEVGTLELMTELFAYMADPGKNKQMNDENKYRTKDNFQHFLQISSFLAREQIGGSDQ